MDLTGRRTWALALLSSMVLVCRVLTVLGAPPRERHPLGPLVGGAIGPGAAVGSAFEPDADTKAFVEYLQACEDASKPKPGSQLCDAYNDIGSFYARLEPEKKTMFSEAFSTFKNTTITQLCNALNKNAPVLKAISTSGSSTEPKYFKTLTDADVCDRRCSDIDDVDDKVVIRPICKVIAYELEQINLKSPVADKPKPETVQHDVPEAVAGQRGVVFQQNRGPETSLPAAEIPIISPRFDGLEKKEEIAKVPVTPALNLPNKATNDSTGVKDPASMTNALKDAQPVVNKSPVEITPGTIPKPADNIPMNEVDRIKNSSTTTEDYGNVLVSGNNEAMDANQVMGKQAGGQQINQQEKPGGSLDNETGGDTNIFMGEDDNEEYQQGEDNEEEIPKSDPDVPLVGATNKISHIAEEKLPEAPLYKKPIQVSGSLELENHAEAVVVREDQSSLREDPFYQEPDSNFFAYFMFLMAVCVVGYVFYHNKSKVLGLLLEGRRSSSAGRGSGGTGSRRRRKHTAQYQKLDSNLEEAISSTGQSRTSQIIY